MGVLSNVSGQDGRSAPVLGALPSGTRVLDAGCGEGLLVEEFRDRLRIEGLDPNYGSDFVTSGSLTALPYESAVFDRALCLDVLEHLSFVDQLPALAELFRVIRPGGELLCDRAQSGAPAVARAFSRRRPPDSRRESRQTPGRSSGGRVSRVGHSAGFRLIDRRGIFPTVPVLTRWIRRNPATLRPLHTLLTRLLPVPGWCFLNVLRFSRP